MSWTPHQDADELLDQVYVTARYVDDLDADELVSAEQLVDHGYMWVNDTADGRMYSITELGIAYVEAEDHYDDPGHDYLDPGIDPVEVVDDPGEVDELPDHDGDGDGGDGYDEGDYGYDDDYDDR